jgi:hypothetical protein
VLLVTATEERTPTLRIISLGAGVQSTVLALMASRGTLRPMPDAAIFADTQAEPAAVYAHLDWLESKLNFPVYRVTQGSLTNDLILGTKGEWASTPPLFTLSSEGGRGMLRRQCTEDYKIAPIKRKIRELLGAPRTGKVRQGLVEEWIGISTDEASRMKPSRDNWICHRWPLIDLGMTRADCLAWAEKHGYPRPPRSACTFCPYHSDEEWRSVKENPQEWADVIKLDRLIRSGVKGTHPGTQLFLHASRRPIEEASFDKGLDGKREANQFENECEGMCGL